MQLVVILQQAKQVPWPFITLVYTPTDTEREEKAHLSHQSCAAGK